MADVEEWLIEAKTARREGRLKDAAELYERAASEETDALRAGHSRRHAAEIWIKNGQIAEGRNAIAWVILVHVGRSHLIRANVTSTVAKRVPKGPVRQRGRKAPTACRGGGAAAGRRRGGLKQ